MKNFSYECYGCIRDCEQCHELNEAEEWKRDQEIIKKPLIDRKWEPFDY